MSIYNKCNCNRCAFLKANFCRGGDIKDGDFCDCFIDTEYIRLCFSLKNCPNCLLRKTCSTYDRFKRVTGDYYEEDI